ncbi:hypothetical protein [Anaerolentibacter hominis]|uniref:hypothetical protein n=1 Tax=Anaerolentibacter hominis TaxID=3079009 RepID=UPI0031B7FD1A
MELRNWICLLLIVAINIAVFIALHLKGQKGKELIGKIIPVLLVAVAILLFQYRSFSLDLYRETITYLFADLFLIANYLFLFYQTQKVRAETGWKKGLGFFLYVGVFVVIVFRGNRTIQALYDKILYIIIFVVIASRMIKKFLSGE